MGLLNRSSTVFVRSAVIPLVQIGVFAVLGLFALAAINFTPKVSATSDRVSTTAKTIETLTRQERDLRLNSGVTKCLVREVRGVQSHTLALKSELAGFNEEIVSQIGDLAAWYNRIETVAFDTKPLGVTVSVVEPRGSEIHLRGSAVTLELALRYVANIRNTDLFVEAQLTSANLANAPVGVVGEIRDDTPQGVLFQIEAKINSDVP